MMTKCAKKMRGGEYIFLLLPLWLPHVIWMVVLCVWMDEIPMTLLLLCFVVVDCWYPLPMSWYTTSVVSRRKFDFLFRFCFERLLCAGLLGKLCVCCVRFSGILWFLFLFPNKTTENQSFVFLPVYSVLQGLCLDIEESLPSYTGFSYSCNVISSRSTEG